MTLMRLIEIFEMSQCYFCYCTNVIDVTVVITQKFIFEIFRTILSFSEPNFPIVMTITQGNQRKLTQNKRDADCI